MGDDLENGLEAGSQEDSQSPETSKAAGAQTSNLDPAALWKQLKPLVERDFQSGKDKGIAELRSTLESFKPVLERVKELIPADKFDALQKDLEFDDLKRRVYGDQTKTPSSDSPAPGTGKSTAAAEVSGIVDDVLQLPGNDPRVTELRLKFGNDPKAYLENALQLYAKIGTKQEATPGEQPPASGGGAAAKEDNPIKNIDDPRELYRLAAKQMDQQIQGKKRRVAS